MPFREAAPKLSAEQYEKNFSELEPAMTASQAAIESARCLYCFDAPCTVACPTHIDVPAFIKKISTGNLHGSAVLCEGACVMLEKGEEAIEIGRLQRHAVDYVFDNNIQLFQPAAQNGKRVACIGAGPAGLALAVVADHADAGAVGTQPALLPVGGLGRAGEVGSAGLSFLRSGPIHRSRW